YRDSYTRALNSIPTRRSSDLLVHAKVPLLNHHTSGVRMEWYRDDLEEARSRDPYPVIKQQLLDHGFTSKEIEAIEDSVKVLVQRSEEHTSELQSRENLVCCLL